VDRACSGKSRTELLDNNFSLLTEDDLHLFNEGSHHRLYQKLGAHCVTMGSLMGTYFAV